MTDIKIAFQQLYDKQDEQLDNVSDQLGMLNRKAKQIDVLLNDDIQFLNDLHNKTTDIDNSLKGVNREIKTIKKKNCSCYLYTIVFLIIILIGLVIVACV